MDLEKRWNDFLGKNGLVDKNNVWDEIKKYHSGLERAYHGLGHLEQGFQEFDLIRGKLKSPNEVEGAFWMHDIIYNINKKDNEEWSVMLAIARYRRLGFDKKYCQNVSKLIGVTKNHFPIKDLPDSKYMGDIDMSILGQDWKKIEEYEEGVFWEAGFHKDFSIDLYKKLRVDFLRGVSNEEQIYFSDEFAEKYEFKARENLLDLINLVNGK